MSSTCYPLLCTPHSQPRPPTFVVPTPRPTGQNTKRRHRFRRPRLRWPRRCCFAAAGACPAANATASAASASFAPAFTAQHRCAGTLCPSGFTRGSTDAGAGAPRATSSSPSVRTEWMLAPAPTSSTTVRGRARRFLLRRRLVRLLALSTSSAGVSGPARRRTARMAASRVRGHRRMAGSSLGWDTTGRAGAPHTGHASPAVGARATAAADTFQVMTGGVPGTSGGPLHASPSMCCMRHRKPWSSATGTRVSSALAWLRALLGAAVATVRVPVSGRAAPRAPPVSAPALVTAPTPAPTSSLPPPGVTSAPVAAGAEGSASQPGPQPMTMDVMRPSMFVHITPATFFGPTRNNTSRSAAYAPRRACWVAWARAMDVAMDLAHAHARSWLFANPSLSPLPPSAVASRPPPLPAPPSPAPAPEPAPALALAPAPAPAPASPATPAPAPSPHHVNRGSSPPPNSIFAGSQPPAYTLSSPRYVGMPASALMPAPAVTNTTSASRRALAAEAAHAPTSESGSALSGPSGGADSGTDSGSDVHTTWSADRCVPKYATSMLESLSSPLSPL